MQENQQSDDIVRLSNAMDAIAQLILKNKKDGTQQNVEYGYKLRQLERLINLILDFPAQGHADVKLDVEELENKFRDGVEIIERDNKKYALIPVKSHTVTREEENKKRSKHKKNKIQCSFCKEMGHKRANCVKRLTTP